MRTVVVNRKILSGSSSEISLEIPDGANSAIEVFDAYDIPDGFPFVVDDDGTPVGCRYLNQYMLDAWAQRGLGLRSLRRFHVYNLARFLRYLRRTRAASSARDANIPVQQWLHVHGEPKIDLTEATRQDLISYRDSRLRTVEKSTAHTEMGCISAFFWYAKQQAWIKSDPVPRWGKAQRNTLLPKVRRRKVEKFLTENQARTFLSLGLRGDGQSEDMPARPERDFAWGLTVTTTGLRREEAAYLLECELPGPDQMPASGIHRFPRTGKGEYTRTIYYTAEAAHGLHLYRTVERPDIIEQAQPRLRRLRRNGELFVVDGLDVVHGHTNVIHEGGKIAADGLTNEQRATAVRIDDDGSIQPLGMWLARGGLPPALGHWNETFARARDRIWSLDAGSQIHRDLPPEHITVTPHTLRHTFAVRMLAALMREGYERAGDPYHLLANPVLTVMQLMGHASTETTQMYLYVAELWYRDVPEALRSLASQVSKDLESIDGLSPVR
jgi:site-specific recombinase XerD